MGIMEIIRYTLLLVQIAVLTGCFVLTLRMIHRDRRDLFLIFYAFGLLNYLLSDLFWLAFTLLRQGARMPFAGNVIGEWAVFLLFAAVLEIEFANILMPTIKEMVWTALFAAVNTVFWIAWSGEWFEDIITGLVFGYFLCVCVRSLKQIRALSAAEWKILGAWSLMLAGLQALTFVPSGFVSRTADLCCYCTILAGIFLVYARILYAFRKGEAAEKLIALSFAGCAFSIVCLYMSSEPVYFILGLVNTGAVLLMFLAVRKKVEEG